MIRTEKNSENQHHTSEKPSFGVLMVRPSNFEYNEQTAVSNFFMDMLNKHQPVHIRALKEFDHFAELLEKHNVDVNVIEAKKKPHSPDSIFPNNWISTHEDGTIVLYPMEAENRRTERRSDIIEELQEEYQVNEIIDLSFYEKQNIFLEGTGSMVLDRAEKIAYACLSSRTHETALKDFCSKTNFRPIVFEAFDEKNKPIYHTNVMMCIGSGFAVIGSESIRDSVQREMVLNSLQASGKEVIEITLEQIHHFAGNMLQIHSKDGSKLIVMSEQAHRSLSPQQLKHLENYGELIFVPLYTIENVGGGSARCMIAEIFLHKIL